jgi:Skp family chaperone for outer membrane proteins
MSMKRKIISSVVGLLILLSVWAICAEDASKPEPASSGDNTKVALLDVNYIFKNHTAFKEEMDQLKKEADEMDKNMKEQQSLMNADAAQLQKMTVGSTEYTEAESRITRAKTDWTVEIQDQRRKFLHREANAYRLAYADINSIVEKYAREHQIDIVIRFMGDPIDSNNPESILAGINKSVIYYNTKTDITPHILKILHDRPKQPLMEIQPSPNDEKPDSKEDKAEKKG